MIAFEERSTSAVLPADATKASSEIDEMFEFERLNVPSVHDVVTSSPKR